MTQINPGTAATLAHNTLTAQINAIIAGASGATKSQAESLLALVDSNMQLIIEASNHQVDEVNCLIDELEQRDAELARSQADAKKAEKELAALQAGRREDERKVREIMATYDQIKNQRDNYKRDADEAGKLRAEVKRLRNQAENHTKAKTKLDAQIASLTQDVQRLKSRLAPTAEAVRGCNELMNFVRNVMIFEGMAVEETIECNGEQYHIYRRPGNIAKAFNPAGLDGGISREHQYYFRIETNCGYHYDAAPLEGGGATYAKAKALPQAVKKHINSLFAAETLYDGSRLTLRDDGLQKRLQEIEAALVPLDALLRGMDRQLITNRVVTNSTVNRNKKKKGK